MAEWTQRLFVVALLSVLVVACGGEDKKTEDMADADQEIEDIGPSTANVTVDITDTLSDMVQTFDSNGTMFTVETRGVYLVIGNLSVLEPGEPVPSYIPGSDEPLGTGWNAIEGYQVIDLLAGGSLGPVDLPVGRGGPIYLGMFDPDQVTVMEGIGTLPLDDGYIVIEGEMAVGETFVKDVVFSMPGGRVLLLGAPAFDLSADRTVAININLDGWFEGVDMDQITHTNNVITVRPMDNEQAYGVISVHAETALDNATVTWN